MIGFRRLQCRATGRVSTSLHKRCLSEAKPPPPPPPPQPSAHQHEAIRTAATYGGILLLGLAFGFVAHEIFPSTLQSNTATPDVPECSPDHCNPQGIVTEKVFIDVKVGDDEGAPVRRIVIGLYGNDVPKTVANFSSMCEVSRPVQS